MLKNTTIKTRLVFVIALLGLELIVGAAIGLVSLSHANGQMQSMYTDGLVCVGELDKIVRAIDENQLNLSRALTVEPAKLPALIEDIERNRGIIDTQWKAYSASSMSGHEQEEAQRFVQLNTKFLDEALRPIVAAVRAGDTARATALVHGPMVELFRPVKTSIDALIQIQLDEAAQANTDAEAMYGTVRLVCLSGMALGLILAGCIGAMLIKSIVRPLDEAVRVAGAVADGDLTQDIRVRANDETGHLMRALNEMNAGLARIVGRVRAGTDTIASASSQIASGNLDLSARTGQQAASLERTATSMEQLTSTVRQNADNARQANTLAQSASQVAARGGAVVTQVVATMGAINTSATRIADIIGVIDGIAFQTNILALNAAVEAARAGEQGRGFAVVASEVRNLAQRSAAAAKEIKSLIDDSVQKVHHGSELVDQAGATMGEIVGSINRVTDIMAEIMAASQEQSSGIEEVNRAIVQMDQATQQNAALVEQASTAAQQLRDEADSLARVVGAFRLGAQARAAARAGVPLLAGARV
jgi:methyl-accepting chemotaxis protein-1 (serine sensor receptor)